MAGKRFNPAEYDTVASRIAEFRKEYPSGRLLVDLIIPPGSDPFEKAIVKCEIYLPGDDRPVASGLAFEVAGTMGANESSHIENADCVPLHSEILTRRGFVPFSTLTLGEEVLAYDKDTDCCVWTPLLNVAVFGPSSLVRLVNKHGFLFECTPDHSWPVLANKWLRCEREMRKTHGFLAGDRLIQAARAEDGDSPVSPSEAAILGWIFTDGHLRWTGNSPSAQIGQSKEENIPGIRELVGAMASEYRDKPRTRTFPPGQTYDTKPCVKWTMRARALRPLLTKANVHDKFDLPALVLRLTHDARATMLRAMMAAEADAKGRFGQKEGPVFEAYQLLATLEGHALGKLSRDTNDVVNLQTLKKRRNVCVSQITVTPAPDAPVWCPTTAFGTWVMRQSGMITITGNTSSKGRALAALGYDPKGTCTREEIRKVIKKQNEAAAREAAVRLAKAKKVTPMEDLIDEATALVIEKERRGAGIPDEVWQAPLKRHFGETDLLRIAEIFVATVGGRRIEQHVPTLVTGWIGQIQDRMLNG